MLCYPSIGQYCGGVLVSNDCVVTAAHCFDNFVSSKVSVCLGRRCGKCSDLDSDGNSQCLKPSSVRVHPDYDNRSLSHDIAVIKLSYPVLCSCKSVIPICLPDMARDGQYIMDGQDGLVTDWGRVNSTIRHSARLRNYVELASNAIFRFITFANQ